MYGIFPIDIRIHFKNKFYHAKQMNLYIIIIIFSVLISIQLKDF